MSDNKNIKRSQSRHLLVQAVYQWQIAQQDLKDIEEQYLVQHGKKALDKDYFCRLLHAIPTMIDKLDRMMEPHLDRPIKNLDPIERAILRIACYELAHCQDVPFKVIINEAVIQAKKFGAEEGHKYINAVLDKVARSVRET